MAVSYHYLKKYLCNPIQTWSVHLLGECSELIRLRAMLAKFFVPLVATKFTEIGGFALLFEKLFTQCNSNLVSTLLR